VALAPISYFVAALLCLIFAQRALWAAAIRFLAATDNLRRGQRAPWAAALWFRPVKLRMATMAFSSRFSSRWTRLRSSCNSATIRWKFRMLSPSRMILAKHCGLVRSKHPCGATRHELSS